jgi:hypothetical protein
MRILTEASLPDSGSLAPKHRCTTSAAKRPNHRRQPRPYNDRITSGSRRHHDRLFCALAHRKRPTP